MAITELLIDNKGTLSCNKSDFLQIKAPCKGREQASDRKLIDLLLLIHVLQNTDGANFSVTDGAYRH